MLHSSPHHWPVDNGPGTEIQCRDVVSRASEAAGLTREMIPGWTVALTDVGTSRTFPAGIARVDRVDGNAHHPRLIFYEAAQLCEAPIMQPCPLFASGLNPISNPREFLKGYSASGALRILHDCLADTVVFISLIPCLLARYLLQLSFGRLGALLLQVLAAVLVLAPSIVDGDTRVVVTVAVSGQIYDPEIHSKHTVGKERLGFVNVADCGNEPLATDEHEFNFTLPVFKHPSLVLTTDERDLFPSGQGPERHHIILAESENPVIVGLRRMLAETPLLLCKPTVGVDNLLDAKHGGLRSQRKALAHLRIDFLLQTIDLEALVFPGSLADPVAGCVAALQSILEKYCLFLRWNQFDGCYQLHGSIIEEPLANVKHIGHFPPSSEAEGIQCLRRQI